MADRKIASVLICSLSGINYHESLYATVLRNNAFPCGEVVLLGSEASCSSCVQTAAGPLA